MLHEANFNLSMINIWLNLHGVPFYCIMKPFKKLHFATDHVKIQNSDLLGISAGECGCIHRIGQKSVFSLSLVDFDHMSNLHYKVTTNSIRIFRSL